MTHVDCDNSAVSFIVELYYFDSHSFTQPVVSPILLNLSITHLLTCCFISSVVYPIHWMLNYIFTHSHLLVSFAHSFILSAPFSEINSLIHSFCCSSTSLLTYFLSCLSLTVSTLKSFVILGNACWLVWSTPLLTSLRRMRSAHLWNAGNVTAGFPELPACLTSTIALNNEWGIQTWWPIHDQEKLLTPSISWKSLTPGCPHAHYWK